MWATTLGSLRLRSRTIIAVLAAGLLLPLAVAPPAQAQGTVTVTVTGQGSATGTGIDCTQSGGPDCSQFYANNMVYDPEIGTYIPEWPSVQFTAGADTNGYVFDGWTGCDTVTDRVCDLTVATDTPLTARFRDEQPPSIGSLTPSSGVQRGTITLAATASDNSGTVSRVDFSVRGVLMGTDTSAPFEVSFDSTAASDGPAILQATAFDPSGKASSVQSSITIDNTAPTVTITSGPDGDLVNPAENHTWTFTTSDAASGLAAVHCSVVPVGSPHSFGSCTGSGSHTVDRRDDGTYEFAVRARDNGGLTTTETRQLTFDGTAPELTVTSGPGPGAVYPAGPHTWEFSASDANGTSAVECVVVPEGEQPVTEACSSPYTVNSLSSGSWTFIVSARDAVGNVNAVTRTFTVDASGPVLAVTSGPAEGSVKPAGTHAWDFSASDATGPLALWCSVAPEGTTPEMGPCTTEASHTSAALGEGEWTFRLRAEDGFGNPTTVTRTFTVDATAPALAVTSGPAEGSIQPTGTHTWDFTASDTHGTPTLTCGIAPQGTTPAMGPCTAAGSHTSTALGGGTWTFKVRAVDGVGNTTTVTRTFTIDAARPTIGKVGPAARSRTHDRTPVVRATVKDKIVQDIAGTLEATDITLRVDGKRRSFKFDAPKLTWQAPRLGYGRHVVKLVVVDQVGNRTTKKWWFKIVH